LIYERWNFGDMRTEKSVTELKVIIYVMYRKGVVEKKNSFIPISLYDSFFV